MPRRGGTSIATSNELQDTGSKHKLTTIRSNNREFNLRTRLESAILDYVGQEERKGECERGHKRQKNIRSVARRLHPFYGYTLFWATVEFVIQPSLCQTILETFGLVYCYNSHCYASL
jgi:hypothetical protein